MPTLLERFKSGWNAFMNKDPTSKATVFEYGSYSRPDRRRLKAGNERSVITTVFNRIATDVSAVQIRHVRTDEDGNYIQPVKSGLNTCFTLEANIDQTGRAFVQDVVMSMFDEGCIAIVPIDTTYDPNKTGSYDIKSMRVGKIVEWYPSKVKVNVYNDRTGTKQDLVMDKGTVAIIENPFYAIMNEPNSTLQRLIRKLNLLDVVDEQSGSGKLDLIVQLPYVIKSDARKVQAENRRKDIEMQLSSSKYGIAYTDGTEHITQLNRPVENKLLSQIEYLTNLLYAQLGITLSILDGTADEKTMLNYNNRIVDVILSTISEECKRKFLTKTAISQNQSIMFFKNPFKFTTIKDLAEAADSLTRNEIVTSNEIRASIGLRKSDNPRSDELINKNLYEEGYDESMTEEPMTEETMEEPIEEEPIENQNGEMLTVADLQEAGW